MRAMSIDWLANIFLAFAVVMAGFGFTRASWSFVGATIAAAIYLERMEISSVLVLLGGASSLWQYRTLRSKVARWIAFGFFLIIAGFAAVHGVHGIRNLKIFDMIRLREDSAEFSLYLNLDKPFIGLWLLLILRDHGAAAFRKLWSGRMVVLLALSGAVAVCLPIALAVGYVRVDPKLPEAWITIPWLLNNLLFVCVTEELFFRGLIQGEVLRAWPRIGLAVAAVLFGLIHFHGGWEYVVLASVAGAFYGLAARRSGTVYAAVAVHFLFNSIHFFLFSYPSLG